MWRQLFVWFVLSSIASNMDRVRLFVQQGVAIAKRLMLRPLVSIMARGEALISSPVTIRKVGGPVLTILRRRNRGHINRISDAKHVLIVRLDEIGDAVLMTPFLRELRRNLPDAKISVVTKPAVTNLLERCPYVDAVLSYDWSEGGGRLDTWRRHWRALRLSRRFWRRDPVDFAILPRWDSDIYHGAFLTYFSGAPRRVAYSERVNDIKRRINAGYDGLFTDVVPDGGVAHEVERNLNLLRFLGASVDSDRLELWLAREDEQFADRVLDGHKASSVIAMGIGARDPRKIWPVSNFIQLGKWLSDTLRAQILLLGGQEERPLAEQLCAHLGEPAINLVGGTTLRQAGALLQRCQLYVGVDTGPMHLAAAAGVPVVAIFCHPKGGSPAHANAPQRFGPWGVPAIVLQPEAQPPCRDSCVEREAHCILGVSLEKVKEAVIRQYPVSDRPQ